MKNVKLAILFSSIIFTVCVYTTPVVANDLEIVMPATAGDILEAIDEENTELEDIVKHHAYSEIHHHALVIRELANGLLKHPEVLSAEQFTQLHEDVKTTSAITLHLDESGRAQDGYETKQDFSKLQKALVAVRSNYNR